MYNNLNEDNDRLPQPASIGIELMEHQKTAIKAMIDLETTGTILAKNIDLYGGNKDFLIDTSVGILADKVGAGKSIMMITLMDQMKKNINKNIAWAGTSRISFKLNNTLKPKCKNLLIVPHKITQQWIDFMQFAPRLKIGTYCSFVDRKKFKEATDFENYDVIILNCTQSKDFFFRFSDIFWRRIIVDEADTIKLQKNVILQSSFTWLVTATPKSLRTSNKKFLSDIFTGLAPWIHKFLIVKNNKEYLDKSIVLPLPKRFIIDCLTPIELDIISQVIPKSIISMINAGNTDKAIKMLNCNVNTTDNIITVVSRNILELLDNKIIELECEQKKNFKEGSKTFIDQQDKIKKINYTINRLETRYESIKEKVYGLNDDLCPICLSEFEKPTVMKCCQHIYCFDCITLSVTKQNLCPYCKKKVTTKSLNIISEKKKKTIDETELLEKELPEKIDTVLNIIKNKPNGKFMIFSNFPETFKKLGSKFIKKKITFATLKGTSGQINKIITDFDNGKINVIMLNTKFFGAGMNLQMATDLIVYHRFNKDLEEQVIGRANRLGRQDSLNVYYLVHDNEDDEFEANAFEDMDYYSWLSEASLEEISEASDSEISEEN